MSRALLSTLAAFALLAVPAGAAELRQNARAVLELFTSQGCSSCPPADARLTDLSRQPDIIALAYHVDYWDYIGWPDTFGAKANSDHQKAYAAAWGSTRIFTPELVINGRQGVVGSREDDVTAAVAKAALAVPVAVAVDGDMLEITIAPAAADADAVIWLVTYKDHAAVTIERGENAGKVMDYTHIVRERRMLGMWDRKTGTHLKLPLSLLTAHDANGAAILVQAGGETAPGPILGAASLQL